MIRKAHNKQHTKNIMCCNSIKQLFPAVPRYAYSARLATYRYQLLRLWHYLICNFKKLLKPPDLLQAQRNWTSHRGWTNRSALIWSFSYPIAEVFWMVRCFSRTKTPPIQLWKKPRIFPEAVPCPRYVPSSLSCYGQFDWKLETPDNQPIWKKLEVIPVRTKPLQTHTMTNRVWFWLWKGWLFTLGEQMGDMFYGDALEFWLRGNVPHIDCSCLYVLRYRKTQYLTGRVHYWFTYRSLAIF